MSIEGWAVIEVMGHKRLAGAVREETLAGQVMLRVDVPATTRTSAFTRYLAGAAVFSLTPVDEDMAKRVAEQIDEPPVERWRVRQAFPVDDDYDEPSDEEDRDDVLDDDDGLSDEQRSDLRRLVSTPGTPGVYVTRDAGGDPMVVSARPIDYEPEGNEIGHTGDIVAFNGLQWIKTEDDGKATGWAPLSKDGECPKCRKMTLSPDNDWRCTNCGYDDLPF
jgi:hypothetical protein